MDPFVFAAVLVAAALHASWSALIKIKLDPFLAIVLIAAAAGIVSLPLLLFMPVVPLAAWPRQERASSDRRQRQFHEIGRAHV